MRFRPTYAALGAFVALVLAAPAALAFTIENKDTEGSYGAPKFDLGEQAKQFSKDGADSSSLGKRDFSTPFGDGKLEFGVRQGPAFGTGLGSPFSSSFESQNMRSHFERVVTPENLR
jgi:hypothetical protein